MSAEEYCARAELAERHATIARSDAERATFHEIAKLWRALASRAAKDGSELRSTARR